MPGILAMYWQSNRDARGHPMSNPYVSDGLCLFGHATVDEAAACAAKGDHLPQVMTVGDQEIVAVPVRPGMDLGAVWDALEGPLTDVRTGVIEKGVASVHCTVCHALIRMDPRGDVLDASGRCDECRP